MSDAENDELMTALGEAARARQPEALDDEEQWERFARGELTEEEAEALGADLPPEERATLRALYAPVDPLVKARIASQLPQKRRAWMPGAVVAGLAAAAIVLLVAWPRGATFPAYSLELSEGAATQRGDEVPSGRYRADDRLEIRLRPATTVADEIDVAVFDGDARWRGPVEIADSGAVRIVGLAGDLFDIGTHALTIVVAPSDALPDVLPSEGLRVRIEVVP